MKVQNTADIHKTGIKMILYSDSGVGKTTRAMHLKDPTFVISAESGLKALKGSKIDYLDISTDDAGNVIAPEDRLARLVEGYKWLLLPEQKAKYQNLFVDSITEIGQNIYSRHERIHLQEVAGGKKYDPFKIWREYGAELIKVIKLFRDMPHYNVVFTALESLEKDDSGKRFYAPEVPGKVAKEFLMPAFDLVFRLAAMPDGKRVFQTCATDTIKAKARGVKLMAAESAELADGGLQRIFDLILVSQQQPEEKK